MNRSQDVYHRISQSLPVLRGWAIAWIVAYHLMGNTRGYLAIEEAIANLFAGSVKNAVESALALFISAGSTGVNVFLIISGFGLTASWWTKYGSQGAKEIPLISFWKKRFVRIFPLFWTAVAIALLLYLINPVWAPFGQSLWSEGVRSPLLAILTTLSTLRNFIPDHYYFLNGAWWYVGLSIQLYFVFPFLVRIGCRYGWFKLLVASLLFSLTYRAVFLLSPIGGESTVPLAFFPSRIFEFVFGMYLAIALLQPTSKSAQSKRINRWLENLLLEPQCLPINLCLFLIGLSFKWLSHSTLAIFAEALISVGLFCSLIGLSQIKNICRDPVFQTIGRYSYGTYLTHMNVYLVLWPTATLLISSYWLRFMLIAIACCIVGIAFEIGFSVCSKAINTTGQKHKQPSNDRC